MKKTLHRKETCLISREPIRFVNNIFWNPKIKLSARCFVREDTDNDEKDNKKNLQTCSC